ncbi:MAG TPA: serine/threonine-protein kinase [Sandaracinaceae bacterium]
MNGGSTSTSGPAEGLVIAGRYELEALIGEGGMARVWRAKDRTLQRLVAVKFLFLREDRDRRTMVDRFLREARIAAAVRHPNVVDLLDFGTTEEGRPFMVMELLAGESLEARLSREPTLTLRELIRIAAGMLDGLAAVHKAGIVHRDLKPDNVFLLDDDGEVRPKLLDFGVSREASAISGRRSSAVTTADGYLVGTPEYMSPEQARGLRDVDFRTDIYSVGVVLYEAMTGRLPYTAEGVGDLIIDIVGGGAPPLATLRPEIGEPLSDVVARAMSPRREDRYQSAREMRDALLAAAEESFGRGVRASLPLIVPVRRPAPEARGARSAGEATTLDGLEIPWGADAVPSPRDRRPSWTVETALPRAPGRPWMFALAVLAIPLAGIATWLALRSSHAPSDALTAPRPAAVQEREPAAPPPRIAPLPEAEHRPAAAPPEPPERVTVTLEDLPRGARVRVDDEWVDAEGGIITLPRDGAAHSLLVLAPGQRTWRGTHEASADGRYRVRLRAARPRGRGDRGRDGRGRDERGARDGTSGVFRDLDY